MPFSREERLLYSPQINQKSSSDLYNENFQKLRNNDPVQRAINNSYKQTMTDDHFQKEGGRQRKKQVPLMDTIMQGDYFGSRQVGFKPRTKYEQQEIHVNSLQKKERPIKKLKHDQWQRPKKAVPDFVRANRKTLGMTKNSITVLKKSYQRRKTLESGNKGPFHVRPQSASASIRRSKLQHQKKQQRKQRPQSAAYGSPSRFSLSAHYQLPHAPQEKISLSEKIRYQPTTRHNEIIATCHSTIRSNSRNNQLSKKYQERMERHRRYDYEHTPKTDRAKKPVVGFRVNGRGKQTSQPMGRRKRVSKQSKHTKAFYDFQRTVMKKRDAKPQGFSIKMAVHNVGKTGTLGRSNSSSGLF